MSLLALTVFTFASIAAPQEMALPKELKVASWMLGTWKGTETYTFDPSAKPEKGPATMTCRMAIGGRYFEGIHSMNMGGMKMEGRHLMTYDPAKKEWGGWWFDSMAPGAMVMHGTADAKMVRMVSEPTPVPGMPEPQVFRSTWTKTGARSLHFTLEMKAGDAWSKAIVGDYKR